MAKTLKANKTFTDRFGNTHSDCYGVIDLCNGNKKKKEQYILFDIYTNKQSRIDNMEPIMQYPYVISGNEFDLYFSAQAVTNDNNQYERAYVYISNVIDEQGNFLWEDWEDSFQ